MQSHHVNAVSPLAFAVSRLHRCESLEQLRLAIFRTFPVALEADAVALYLLDPEHYPVSIFSWHTSQNMLREYERYRAHDPLFNYILRHKAVSNYQYLIGKDIWLRSPIHEIAQRYGLENVMEGPIVLNGRVIGTMRAGRTSERGNFNPLTMQIQKFLCEEVAFVLSRLNDDRLSIAEKIKPLPGQDSITGSEYCFTDLKNFTNLSTPRSTLQTEALSGQLKNVADRLIVGKTNKRIARELGITENTVKYHVKRLFKHYGVSNRVELTRVYGHLN